MKILDRAEKTAQDVKDSLATAVILAAAALLCAAVALVVAIVR